MAGGRRSQRRRRRRAHPVRRADRPGRRSKRCSPTASRAAPQRRASIPPTGARRAPRAAGGSARSRCRGGPGQPRRRRPRSRRPCSKACAAHGLDLLPWSEARRVAARTRRLRARATIRRCPISPTRRCSPRSTTGCRRCSRASAGSTRSIRRACRRARRPARLGRGASAVDRLAPGALRDARRAAATRSTMPPKPGPTVEVRVQALFGLAAHPTVAGGTCRWCSA